MKLVPKKRGRKPTIEYPELSLSSISLILKKYTEQALKKGGLSVDSLAYSENLKQIVNSVNSELFMNLTEKDVYFILLFLRKTRKLPKLFRQTEEIAA